MPDYGMRIRTAVLDDLEAILKILSECPKVSWSQAQVAEELVGSGKLSLVGLCDEEIVAFCFVRVAEETAELLLIATRAQVRGKGYAYGIACEISRKLKALDVSEVFLEVRRGNLPAIRLYERLGYISVATRPNYYRDPIEDAIIFKLPLTDCQSNNSGLE